MTNVSLTAFCFNASEDTLTEEMWHLEEEHETSKLVIGIFYLIICALGLPCNLLVIVTIVKEKLYKDPSVLLLLNLVINDLFAVVIVLPMYIVVGLPEGYILGDNDSFRCKLCRLSLLDTTFAITLAHAMGLLSFDRFLYFYKPLKYKRIITIPRLLITIALSWVSAIIVSAIPLYDFNALQVVFYRTNAGCSVDNHPSDINIFFFVLCVVCILPALTVLVCNVWMIHIVQKAVREVYNVKKLATNNEEKEFREKIKQIRRKKQFNLIRVFGGILLCTFLSCLPILVLMLLFIFLDVEEIPIGYQATGFIAFYAQTTIHPILESTLMHDVKEPLKKTLCFCCSKMTSKTNCICLCSVESSHCYKDFCGKLEVFLEISSEIPVENDFRKDDVTTPAAIVEPACANSRNHCCLEVEVKPQNLSNNEHITPNLSYENDNGSDEKDNAVLTTKINTSHSTLSDEEDCSANNNTDSSDKTEQFNHSYTIVVEFHETNQDLN